MEVRLYFDFSIVTVTRHVTDDYNCICTHMKIFESTHRKFREKQASF
jgi:hypothetical protein